MLHTIAHYGFLAASAFACVCAVLLLFMAAAWVDSLKEDRGNLVWQVPAWVVGLGTFWGLVAAVLSRV
jgi:hypothetical protein